MLSVPRIIASLILQVTTDWLTTDMQEGLLDGRIWKELVADCGLDPCERPQVCSAQSWELYRRRTCHVVCCWHLCILLEPFMYAARCSIAQGGKSVVAAWESHLTLTMFLHCLLQDIQLRDVHLL